MAAAATELLVLGAATRASGESLTDGEHPLTAGLDHAGTLDRASFTLALDSLVRGLESVHTEVRGVDA